LYSPALGSEITRANYRFTEKFLRGFPPIAQFGFVFVLSDTYCQLR
jgi:hypothetical protein